MAYRTVRSANTRAISLVLWIQLAVQLLEMGKQESREKRKEEKRRGEERRGEKKRREEK